ncbi:MAG TPA: hypothetical protein VHU86_09070 [Solirubrobacterales bacterium]|jgi:hypothetical protein|nr:hypothetical protein [Solirubrobacterales bacterium]
MADSGADEFGEGQDRVRFKVLSLDKEGEAEVAQVLAEFSAFVGKVEAEAAERMAETGEEPITGKVWMAAFPMPLLPTG